jgi:hypothetical protein
MNQRAHSSVFDCFVYVCECVSVSMCVMCFCVFLFSPHVYRRLTLILRIARSPLTQGEL